MIASIGQQPIKDARREGVDSAIAKSIFGSPVMVVDSEPYWGHDRLEQMARCIRSGDW